MTRAKVLAGFDQSFADLRGSRLRFFVAGAGPGIVLVHGLGGAASNWADLAPVLARRFRVLVPDLPGHGGSSPLPATPTVGALAERVALLAERTGLHAPIVVGHSLGGVVALRYALRRPDGVAGVVLAGSAGFSPSGRRAEHALVISSLVRPGRWVAPFRRAVARSLQLRRLTLGWGLADPAAPSHRAIEGFLAGPGLHTDTGSAARALIADDLHARLADIRCPTLVLWGARDTLTPVSDGFEYARRLGSTVRVIADCGHLLIGERPESCADAIAEFSDRVRKLDEAPLEVETLG